MKSHITEIARVALLLLAATAQAQSPNIVSYHGNGELTWTNNDTNLFYQIQWSSSLTQSNAWRSNYLPLTDIQSSDSILTSSVPMFYRVCGTSNRVVYPSPIAKTGQKGSNQTGDDGDLQKGIPWPNPRFAIQENTNVVLDNLTGLMWARNANSFAPTNWNAAVSNCNDLVYGGYDDWRLPNRRELLSLIDDGEYHPALPAGHPFSVAPEGTYWTSTTSANGASGAWFVELYYGVLSGSPMSSEYYVWPVRSGQ